MFSSSPKWRVKVFVGVVEVAVEEAGEEVVETVEVAVVVGVDVGVVEGVVTVVVEAVGVVADVEEPEVPEEPKLVEEEFWVDQKFFLVRFVVDLLILELQFLQLSSENFEFEPLKLKMNSHSKHCKKEQN